MTKSTEASMVFEQEIRSRVLRIEPHLVPGSVYSPEEVCGWKFWAKLDDHQQCAAARCLADMVRQGLLPLKLNGQISAYAMLELGIEEESQQEATIEVSRPEGAHDE